MAFCTTCGNEIDDKASICIKCGVPTQNLNKEQSSQDETLLAVLGGLGVFGLTIFIPILGVILGVVLTAVFLQSKQKAAKAIGLATAGAVVFNILAFLVFYLFLFSIS